MSTNDETALADRLPAEHGPGEAKQGEPGRVDDALRPGAGKRLEAIRDAAKKERHRLVIVDTADLDWLLGFLP